MAGSFITNAFLLFGLDIGFEAPTYFSNAKLLYFTSDSTLVKFSIIIQVLNITEVTSQTPHKSNMPTKLY